MILSFKILARLFVLWFRYFPYVRMNEFFYHRICVRFFNSRNYIMRGKTSDGSRFTCRLGDFIQGYLFYFGVWEPHLSAYLLSNLSEDDVFVDVGANVGYYSAIAAKRCRNVVCFEASPSIFSLLEDTIALNDIQNVKAVNIAVGEACDKVDIYSGRDFNIGQTTIIKERASMRKGMKFETTISSAPLSELLTQDEKQNARFIKMDIEGAEYPVLTDIFEHLDEYHPAMELLVEFSPEDCVRFGVQPEEFMTQAREVGFFVYLIRNECFSHDYTKRAPIEPPIQISEFPDDQIDIVLSRRNVPQL